MKNFSYLKNKKLINIFLLSAVCVFIFLINKYDFNELKKNSVFIIKQNIKLVSFFSFLKINNSFNLSKTEKAEFEIDKVKYRIKKFKFKKLKDHGPRSYIRIYDNNLFLITGTGFMSFNSINNVKKDQFNLDIIKSNFQKIVGVNYISEARHVVKGFLINDDKIYISYLEKTKRGDTNFCYRNSIVVANLNYNKLRFKDFFKSKSVSCITDWGEDTRYFEKMSGGNIEYYKDNKILLTVGAFHDVKTFYKLKKNLNDTHDTNNLFGKIVSIDINSSNYEIISSGHRNPQGLYYDNKNDIIYSTDHGPQGGDEINADINPISTKIKNYGWPKSSYGEHYGFPKTKLSDGLILDELYKLAPLKKSHAYYGFIEPLKYFNPSVAPSQIIKANHFSKESDKTTLYVATLKGRSLHKLVIDDEMNIVKHSILPFGERIRDIIFSKELNKILLFLESSATLATLEII